jgi:hypothetical protein
VAGDIRPHRVYGLALALGAAGLGIAAAAVVTAAGSVHRESAAEPMFTLGGLHLTYPAVNGAGGLLLILAAAATSVIASALVSIWRHRRAYRDFTARLGPVRALTGAPGVNVISASRPQAFCAGYFRPSIYVSRRTVELLTDAELEVVLAHERHHRRLRDPLRIAGGRVLSHALFFLPVLGPLVDREAEIAELRADHAAVSGRERGEAALASALLAFEDSGPVGTTGISPERVDALIGQPSQWRLPAGRLTLSLMILAALTVLVWQISGAASAYASLNLPILSSRPCAAVMTALAGAGIAVLSRRARRANRRRAGVPKAR